MMNEAPSSALVIVAHPDDLEIHSAGTIAKWVSKHNTQVIAVVSTSGDKGNRRRRQWHQFELGMIREREQVQAAAVLGIEKVIFLRYPDGNVPYDRAFKAQIAYLIRHYRPEAILTHDPWRHYLTHPDHRNVGYSVVDAIGLAREYDFMPVLDALEIPPFQPSKLFLCGSETPNHFEDISEFMEVKLRALICYSSQFELREGFEAGIKKRAQEVGRRIEAEFAESFRVISFRRAGTARR